MKVKITKYIDNGHIFIEQGGAAYRRNIANYKNYLALRNEASHLFHWTKKLQLTGEKYYGNGANFTTDVGNYLRSEIKAYKTRLFPSDKETVIAYKVELQKSKYYRKSREGKVIPLDFSHTFHVGLNESYAERAKKFRTAKEEIKLRIQEFRFNQRSIRMNNRHYTPNDGRRNFTLQRQGSEAVGWIHPNPNAYANILLLKNSDDVYKDKKPVTNVNHIGIELEFYSKANQTDMEGEVVRRKLDKFVQIKHDGSIKAEPNYTAMEMAILAPEDKISEVIHELCKILESGRAKVNKTCGMHVHLDMRNRDKSRCFSNLVSAQPILYAMNPKSRLDSRYCKKTKSKTFKETGNRDDRYQGINPEAYNKHGTLEVRIHAGTISEAKIMNWVKLLLAIINKKDEVKRAPTSFKAFVKKFDIEYELATYIAERIFKFHTPETGHVDIEEAA